MKINEIKETKEIVVKTQYIAEDGTIFYDQEQCKKYEESALFAIQKQLKKICDTDEMSLIDNGSDEDVVEVYDIQTNDDLINLRRYLYLKMQNANISESNMKDCFESREGRKGYSFDTVTYGHEVLIWWDYDQTFFWVYGDGSIEGYMNKARERFNKIIYPVQTTE